MQGSDNCMDSEVIMNAGSALFLTLWFRHLLNQIFLWNIIDHLVQSVVVFWNFPLLWMIVFDPKRICTRHNCIESHKWDKWGIKWKLVISRIKIIFATKWSKLDLINERPVPNKRPGFPKGEKRINDHTLITATSWSNHEKTSYDQWPFIRDPIVL